MRATAVAKRKTYGTRQRPGEAVSAVHELRDRKTRDGGPAFVQIPWSFIAELWRLYPESPGPMVALMVYAESNSYGREWAPARGTSWLASLGNVDQQSIRYAIEDGLKRRMIEENPSQRGCYRTTWRPNDKQNPWRQAEDYPRRRPVKSAENSTDDEEDEDQTEEKPTREVVELISRTTIRCGHRKKVPVKTGVKSITVEVKAEQGAAVQVRSVAGDVSVTVSDPPEKPVSIDSKRVSSPSLRQTNSKNGEAIKSTSLPLESQADVAIESPSVRQPQTRCASLTTDEKKVASAVRYFGVFTDYSAKKFVENCRAVVADASAERIVELVKAVGTPARASRSTRNPIGVIVSQVPELLSAGVNPARSGLKPRRLSPEEDLEEFRQIRKP